MPDMQAVRAEVEKIEMEKTGERRWPNWVTREVVDSIGGRKRGDHDEGDGAE